MVLVTEHYHSWWVTLACGDDDAREIGCYLCLWREWMAELGKRSSVAVPRSVKSKLPHRCGAGVGSVASEYLGRVCRDRAFVAAVLTLWSMLQYLSAARGDGLISDVSPQISANDRE